MKKNCKKVNKKEFRIEKIIKRKANKLYVKWKAYNDSFNNWIDKKDIVLYFPKATSLEANVKAELDLFKLKKS